MGLLARTLLKELHPAHGDWIFVDTEAVAEETESDGRIRSVVVDVERPGLISFGLARHLLDRMGAVSLTIEDLKTDHLLDFLRPCM